MFTCSHGPNTYPSNPKKACCPTQQCKNTKFTCKTPQDQVNDLIRLINTTIIVQTVWLDFESGYNSGNWTNPATNQQILQEFKNVLKITKWNLGIYRIR